MKHLANKIGQIAAQEMGVSLPVIGLQDFLSNLHKSATVRSLLKEALHRAEMEAFFGVRIMVADKA